MPKFYSEQFKHDAVARYENNEDLTLAAAAAELGVNRATLHQWKKEFGTGRKSRMAEAKAQAESVSHAERMSRIGGSAKIKSTPGQGTEFTLTIAG